MKTKTLDGSIENKELIRKITKSMIGLNNYSIEIQRGAVKYLFVDFLQCLWASKQLKKQNIKHFLIPCSKRIEKVRVQTEKIDVFKASRYFRNAFKMQQFQQIEISDNLILVREENTYILKRIEKEIETINMYAIEIPIYS